MTETPSRSLRLFLALVVLFLGGSGLVYEYCLSTLATHLLGNSIEQFSLIIALMLFAMGVAGQLQRRVPDGPAVAEVFVAVEILLALVGGTSAVGLYLAFAWLDHFHIALYSLAILIGLGIGMEIPLLMRINQRWRADLADNVGDVFSLDYLGALIGALIWAFFLLPLMPLDQISLVLGGVNLVVAGLSLWVFWPGLVRKGRLVALCGAAIAALGALALWGPTLIDDARQGLFADPIRLHVRSPYQDIVVTGHGGRMSMYLNGKLQFDSEDEFIYHEMLVHPAALALGRPPARVLILGGGDGLAVREVLRWPGVASVTLVDLDPAVTSLAREWPPLVTLTEGALVDARVDVRAPAGISPGATQIIHKRAEAPRLAVARHEGPIAEVRLMHLDADLFVRDLTGPYDLIIADFPDPSSPDLAKLYSAEFYTAVKAQMAPGAVLVVQSSSPYTNRSAFWCVARTLQEAGLATTALHAHVPTFGAWGWQLARVGAAPDPKGAPPFPTRYLTPEVLAASRVFPPTMAAPGEGQCTGSTRLDPQVMRLYLRGEPLVGQRWFPGTAER